MSVQKRSSRTTLRAMSGLLMTATVLLFTSVEARAEGFDLQQFNPMPDLSKDFFSTSSATVSPHLHWSAFLGMNYSQDPLVMRGPDGELMERVVANQATGHLMFSLGLFDRAEIGVDLPLIVWQEGTALPSRGLTPDQSYGVGDLRLVPRVNLLNTRSSEHSQGLALAVLLDAHLPTGDSRSLQGGDLRVGPRVAMDANPTADLRLAANLGYRYRQRQEIGDLMINDTLGWNAAAEYQVIDDLRLTAEVFGKVTLLSEGIRSAESPMEILAGGKYQLGHILLAAAAGGGLGNGYGTPSWRGFLAIGHAQRGPVQTTLVATEPVRESEPEPVAQEPEPEPEPECRVDDDCGSSSRCSGQVVQDTIGRCRAGLCVMEEREITCDASQICSTVQGQAACVEPPRVQVDEDRGEIELRETIFFDTASATIDRRSFALLDEVAALLRDNPQIRRISIEGHTDIRGSRTRNRILSQRRAESVMAYLLGAGIDVERMEAVGFGSEQPIAPNDTEENLALNRRVVLRILEIAE